MRVGAPDSLGTRIKRARERRRLSQKEVAAALKVDVKTIDNWEHGRTKPRSSLGALEDFYGEDFTSHPAGLPPIVAEHQNDPEVMAIWNIKIIPPRSREGMIVTLLKLRDGAR